MNLISDPWVICLRMIGPVCLVSPVAVRRPGEAKSTDWKTDDLRAVLAPSENDHR